MNGCWGVPRKRARGDLAAQTDPEATGNHRNPAMEIPKKAGQRAPHMVNYLRVLKRFRTG